MTVRAALKKALTAVLPAGHTNFRLQNDFRIDRFPGVPSGAKKTGPEAVDETNGYVRWRVAVTFNVNSTSQEEVEGSFNVCEDPASCDATTTVLRGELTKPANVTVFSQPLLGAMKVMRAQILDFSAFHEVKPNSTDVAPWVYAAAHLLATRVRVEEDMKEKKLFEKTMLETLKELSQAAKTRNTKKMAFLGAEAEHRRAAALARVMLSGKKNRDFLKKAFDDADFAARFWTTQQKLSEDVDSLRAPVAELAEASVNKTLAEDNKAEQEQIIADTTRAIPKILSLWKLANSDEDIPQATKDMLRERVEYNQDRKATAIIDLDLAKEDLAEKTKIKEQKAAALKKRRAEVTKTATELRTKLVAQLDKKASEAKSKADEARALPGLVPQDRLVREKKVKEALLGVTRATALQNAQKKVQGYLSFNAEYIESVSALGEATQDLLLQESKLLKRMEDVVTCMRKGIMTEKQREEMVNAKKEKALSLLEIIRTTLSPPLSFSSRRSTARKGKTSSKGSRSRGGPPSAAPASLALLQLDQTPPAAAPNAAPGATANASATAGQPSAGAGQNATEEEAMPWDQAEDRSCTEERSAYTNQTMLVRKLREERRAVEQYMKLVQQRADLTAAALSLGAAESEVEESAVVAERHQLAFRESVDFVNRGKANLVELQQQVLLTDAAVAGSYYANKTLVDEAESMLHLFARAVVSSGRMYSRMRVTRARKILARKRQAMLTAQVDKDRENAVRTRMAARMRGLEKACRRATQIQREDAAAKREKQLEAGTTSVTEEESSAGPLPPLQCEAAIAEQTVLQDVRHGRYVRSLQVAAEKRLRFRVSSFEFRAEKAQQQLQNSQDQQAQSSPKASPFKSTQQKSADSAAQQGTSTGNGTNTTTGNETTKPEHIDVMKNMKAAVGFFDDLLQRIKGDEKNEIAEILLLLRGTENLFVDSSVAKATATATADEQLWSNSTAAVRSSRDEFLRVQGDVLRAGDEWALAKNKEKAEMKEVFKLGYAYADAAQTEDRAKEQLDKAEHTTDVWALELARAQAKEVQLLSERFALDSKNTREVVAEVVFGSLRDTEKFVDMMGISKDPEESDEDKQAQPAGGGGKFLQLHSGGPEGAALLQLSSSSPLSSEVQERKKQAPVTVTPPSIIASEAEDALQANDDDQPLRSAQGDLVLLQTRVNEIGGSLAAHTTGTRDTNLVSLMQTSQGVGDSTGWPSWMGLNFGSDDPAPGLAQKQTTELAAAEESKLDAVQEQVQSPPAPSPLTDFAPRLGRAARNYAAVSAMVIRIENDRLRAQSLAEVAEGKEKYAAAKWTLHRVRKEVKDGFRLIEAQQEVAKALLQRVNTSCNLAAGKQEPLVDQTLPTVDVYKEIEWGAQNAFGGNKKEGVTFTGLLQIRHVGIDSGGLQFGEHEASCAEPLSASRLSHVDHVLQTNAALLQAMKTSTTHRNSKTTRKKEHKNRQTPPSGNATAGAPGAAGSTTGSTTGGAGVLSGAGPAGAGAPGGNTTAPVVVPTGPLQGSGAGATVPGAAAGVASNGTAVGGMNGTSGGANDTNATAAAPVDGCAQSKRALRDAILEYERRVEAFGRRYELLTSARNDLAVARAERQLAVESANLLIFQTALQLGDNANGLEAFVQLSVARATRRVSVARQTLLLTKASIHLFRMRQQYLDSQRTGDKVFLDTQKELLVWDEKMFSDSAANVLQAYERAVDLAREDYKKQKGLANTTSAVTNAAPASVLAQQRKLDAARRFRLLALQELQAFKFQTELQKLQKTALKNADLDAGSSGGAAAGAPAAGAAASGGQQAGAAFLQMERRGQQGGHDHLGFDANGVVNHGSSGLPLLRVDSDLAAAAQEVATDLGFDTTVQSDTKALLEDEEDDAPAYSPVVQILGPPTRPRRASSTVPVASAVEAGSSGVPQTMFHAEGADGEIDNTVPDVPARRVHAGVSDDEALRLAAMSTDDGMMTPHITMADAIVEPVTMPVRAAVPAEHNHRPVAAEVVVRPVVPPPVPVSVDGIDSRIARTTTGRTEDHSAAVSGEKTGMLNLAEVDAGKKIGKKESVTESESGREVAAAGASAEPAKKSNQRGPLDHQLPGIKKKDHADEAGTAPTAVRTPQSTAPDADIVRRATRHAEPGLVAVAPSVSNASVDSMPAEEVSIIRSSPAIEAVSRPLGKKEEVKNDLALQTERITNTALPAEVSNVQQTLGIWPASLLSVDEDHSSARTEDAKADPKPVKYVAPSALWGPAAAQAKADAAKAAYAASLAKQKAAQVKASVLKAKGLPTTTDPKAQKLAAQAKLAVGTIQGTPISGTSSSGTSGPQPPFPASPNANAAQIAMSAMTGAQAPAPATAAAALQPKLPRVVQLSRGTVDETQKDLQRMGMRADSTRLLGQAVRQASLVELLGFQAAFKNADLAVEDVKQAIDAAGDGLTKVKVRTALTRGVVVMQKLLDTARVGIAARNSQTQAEAEAYLIKQRTFRDLLKQNQQDLFKETQEARKKLEVNKVVFLDYKRQEMQSHMADARMDVALAQTWIITLAARAQLDTAAGSVARAQMTEIRAEHFANQAVNEANELQGLLGGAVGGVVSSVPGLSAVANATSGVVANMTPGRKLAIDAANAVVEAQGRLSLAVNRTGALQDFKKYLEGKQAASYDRMTTLLDDAIAQAEAASAAEEERKGVHESRVTAAEARLQVSEETRDTAKPGLLVAEEATKLAKQALADPALQGNTDLYNKAKAAAMAAEVQEDAARDEYEKLEVFVRVSKNALRQEKQILTKIALRMLNLAERKATLENLKQRMGVYMEDRTTRTTRIESISHAVAAYYSVLEANEETGGTSTSLSTAESTKWTAFLQTWETVKEDPLESMTHFAVENKQSAAVRARFRRRDSRDALMRRVQDWRSMNALRNQLQSGFKALEDKMKTAPADEQEKLKAKQDLLTAELKAKFEEHKTLLVEIGEAEKSFVSAQRLDVLRRAEAMESYAKELYLNSTDGTALDQDRLRLNYEAKSANLEVAQRAVWELMAAVGKYEKKIVQEATEERGESERAYVEKAEAISDALSASADEAKKSKEETCLSYGDSATECEAATRALDKVQARIDEVQAALKMNKLRTVEEDKCRTARNALLVYRKSPSATDKRLAWSTALIDCNVARSDTFSSLLKDDLQEGVACEKEFAPAVNPRCTRKIERAKQALEEHTLSANCEALEARSNVLGAGLREAAKVAAADKSPENLEKAGKKLLQLEETLRKMAENSCNADDDSLNVVQAEAALLCSPPGLDCLREAAGSSNSTTTAAPSLFLQTRRVDDVHDVEPEPVKLSIRPVNCDTRWETTDESETEVLDVARSRRSNEASMKRSIPKVAFDSQGLKFGDSYLCAQQCRVFYPLHTFATVAADLSCHCHQEPMCDEQEPGAHTVVWYDCGANDARVVANSDECVPVF
ncbi:unnamed protein product [Amoebophrya sp. A120]|nr:unnamed protein product [Amoebophrya sp. A120]|eukprot:GSA120T00002170001.1